MFRIAFLTQFVLFARSLEYIYSPLARISNVRWTLPGLDGMLQLCESVSSAQ